MDAVSGERLPGAHVYVNRDGTPVGTVTDANGAYSFPFIPGEIVTISFVGYSPETFEADGRAGWEHGLARATYQLDEFTVTPNAKPNLLLWGLLILGVVLATRRK